MLLFTLAFTFATHAAEPIGGICGGTSVIGHAQTAGDLVKSVQSLCEHFSTHDKIQTACSGLLPELQHRPASESAAVTAGDKSPLAPKLDALATTVQAEVRKDQGAAGNPIAAKISYLERTYPDEQTRRAHLKTYLEDLKSLMALTQAGRKVLACWKSATSQEIAGERIYLPKPGVTPDFTAMFYVTRANQPEPSRTEKALETTSGTVDSTKFWKVIAFNVEKDPVEAAHVLLHEMQHGCATLQAVQDRKDLDKEMPALQARKAVDPVLAKTVDDEQGLKLADECRAHRSQVDFYREIAKASPALVCNYYYRSGKFNGQVISSGQFMSAIESEISEGSFPGLLAREYKSADGPTEWRKFFEMDGDKPKNLSDGSWQLKPSIADAFKAAGCPVSQGAGSRPSSPSQPPSTGF